MLTLLLTLLADLPNNSAESLRYVRPAEGGWALESEVQEIRTRDGILYQSVTHRPGQKMTLKVSYDLQRRLNSAEILLETKQAKSTAKVAFDKGTANLRREGKEESFKLSGEPVVTTAPDWSDIFLLVRRYDRAKGGRQEFPGFWFHPREPARVLTFAIERLGEDALLVKERRQTLARYRVTLRSGGYLVWADDAGRVCKLIPAGNPKSAVVLQGYEEAAAGLK